MTRPMIQVPSKPITVQYEVFKPEERDYPYVSNFTGSYYVLCADRNIRVIPGDYLIKVGERDEYFPMPPEIFKMFFYG